ncbi:MAG: hypothetical protein KKA07_00195 [Bacteroidetes bacterium]|nr:hypothetical protein [Bacteroidota bacterium]MBU1717470.1 hypothetical protein [Bacteroidota bacterium]
MSLRLDSSTFSLWKISSRGYVIWQKTVKLDFNFSHGSTVANLGSHIYLIGEREIDSVPSLSDFVVVRLSNNGDLEWVKIYDTPEWESRVTGMKTSDNDLIMCGKKAESCYSGNPFFAKVNIEGDTLWSRTIFESVYVGKYKIIEAKDGSYMIYGYTGEVVGDENGYLRLIKMDRNGKVLWATDVCKARWYPNGIAETTSGDILICGASFSAGDKIPLVCTDANGMFKWEKSYELWEEGGSGYQILNNGNRTFKIFGVKNHEQNIEDQFGVLLIDEEGNELHKITYPNFWNAKALRHDDNCTYLFWNHFSYIYMTKLDQNGNPVMLDQW